MFRICTECDKGEFTCDNGLCVNTTSRCDDKPDCKDGSDEDSCGPTTTTSKDEHELRLYSSRYCHSYYFACFVYTRSVAVLI